MYETISACIQCNTADLAPVVLMPGDPLRAQFIAENYLDDPVLFNKVRNMLGYTGTYQGARVSVMGSGMGVPSICLYAHELYLQLGVEAIIRVGTAGGLGDHVGLHDVVVVEIAGTNSGVAAAYGFDAENIPAPSDGLLRRALEAGSSMEAPCRAGRLFSTDLFYEADDGENERLLQAGYAGVDMETAGLYLEAARCGKDALSVCTCANHLMTGEGLSAQEREESFDAMVRIALSCV